MVGIVERFGTKDELDLPSGLGFDCLLSALDRPKWFINARESEGNPPTH